MKLLPQARNTNLIENELGQELLIYDLTIHKAYSLNETSTIVYQACGQGLTFDELKRKHQFTDDLIYLALDELKQNNLLENADYKSALSGLSRREAIRKVGLATMIALPVIVGLTAPQASMAQSATCPSGQGPLDINGNQGNGSNCVCNTGGGSNDGGFRACNTTRGGDGGDTIFGCRAGCLCKSSQTNVGVVLNGTCG